MVTNQFYEFELQLPKPWVGRNVWDRLHWGAKAGYMKFLNNQFTMQTQQLEIPWPLVDVEIDATRHSPGVLDRDNIVGGLKPYLDAMTARHPKGIGLIVDDTEEFLIRLETYQEKVKKADMPDMQCSVFAIYGRPQNGAT